MTSSDAPSTPAVVASSTATTAEDIAPTTSTEKVSIPPPSMNPSAPATTEEEDKTVTTITILSSDKSNNVHIPSPLEDEEVEYLAKTKLALMRSAHADHVSTPGMLYRLKRWNKLWASAHADCLQFANKCNTCQRYNSAPSRRLDMVTPSATQLFHTVEMDIMAPTLCDEHKKEINKYKYLLVLVDVFSGYTMIRLLEGKGSDAVANALISIFTDYGSPNTIITDQGGEFTAHKMKTIFNLFQTKHKLGFPGVKHATGKVERRIRDVRSLLSKLLCEHNDYTHNWTSYVFFLQYYINSRWSRVTNISPFFMMYGREPRLLLEDGMTLDENDDEVTIATKGKALSQWFMQRNYSDTNNIINVTRHREDYIRKYANDYNYKYNTKQTPHAQGTFLRFMTPRTNKLDPIWSDPVAVVHYNKKGYKLRYLGGSAAQILPGRYPHQLLRLCANQEEIKKKDEETIYVYQVVGKKIEQYLDDNNKRKYRTSYEIVPLAKPDQKIWVQELQGGLIPAYESIRASLPKSQQDSAVYTVNFDFSLHPFLQGKDYVDSDTEDERRRHYVYLPVLMPLFTSPPQ